MFNSAKRVFSGALATAAVLLVLWIVGVVNTPGARGMAAVGAGISAIIKAFVDLLASIHF